jgi:hypothetical protein
MSFFPDNKVLDREAHTSTHAAIVLPFYIPYRDSGTNWGSKQHSSHLDAWQSAYFVTGVAASFEYIHALFFTKRLKVPNLLGQSVAGKVIQRVVMALYSRSDPTFKLTLPSMHAALASAEKRKKELLGRGEVDNYGGLLAVANMAHALGATDEKITIHSSDQHKLQRLLKLARAMLQKPVNFMQQPLYPLSRLQSIPDYTGTNADTREHGSEARPRSNK